MQVVKHHPIAVLLINAHAYPQLFGKTVAELAWPHSKGGSMTSLKAGIVGVTGYAGTELARWLLSHQRIDLCRVYSTRHAGASLSEIVPSLFGLYDLRLQKPVSENFAGLTSCFRRPRTVLPNHLRKLQISFRQSSIYQGSPPC